MSIAVKIGEQNGLGFSIPALSRVELIAPTNIDQGVKLSNDSGGYFLCANPIEQHTENSNT